MIGRHEADPVVVEPLSADIGNRECLFGQALEREAPEGDDDSRLDDFNLAANVRTACVELVLLGIAILGRPAFHHISDVDVVACQMHRFDDVGEKLPRPPDERFALDVFVAARRLADEHQIGVGIADAENNLRSAPRQSAFFASHYDPLEIAE